MGPYRLVTPHIVGIEEYDWCGAYYIFSLVYRGKAYDNRIYILINKTSHKTPGMYKALRFLNILVDLIEYLSSCFMYNMNKKCPLSYTDYFYQL